MTPVPPASRSTLDLSWARLAAALAAPMAEAAGEGATPVSIALELGPASAAERVVCRAWVARGTRTLVFLGSEARDADGALAASATAVFRRG